MENTARDELMMQLLKDLSESQAEQDNSECDILEFRMDHRDRDSLYENFINEIDAWARRTLTTNGFGDY